MSKKTSKESILELQRQIEIKNEIRLLEELILKRQAEIQFYQDKLEELKKQPI